MYTFTMDGTKDDGDDALAGLIRLRKEIWDRFFWGGVNLEHRISGQIVSTASRLGYTISIVTVGVIFGGIFVS